MSTLNETPSASVVDASVLLEFMFRLAQALLACGEQTAQVELKLRRIAAAFGMRRSRIVVFPTAVFITFHDDDKERITLAEGPNYTLRLDQIADVYALADEAEDALLQPREGLDRLAHILSRVSRFGWIGGVVGHIVLTAGLAMVLEASLPNVAAAAFLGAVVGVLKLANQGRPVLAVPTPVIAAALVAALVMLAQKYGLPIDPAYVLVPPLVTFLPGAMLTTGMVELAYGDMVAGSSRLITGFVQLVLLAFGFVAGVMLTGYQPQDLAVVPQYAAAGWSSVAQWAAVLVFGVGVYMHFSAPQRSMAWVLLVLAVTFAAQQFATRIFSAEISGFFGMLVATPLGYLIQTRFRGPPAMVTFLPAFWLVVPGSLGLRSVAHLLSDRAAGLEGLVTVVFAIASIALGTLVGASIYKVVTEQFGWWQLQVGRVGAYVRRGKRR